MGTRTGREAETTDDAPSRVCDTGPVTAGGTLGRHAVDSLTGDSAAGDLTADVAVIGGGVIGHGIAFEASRAGRSVVVIDDAPGSGASWAAAGMLAPVS